MPEIIRDGVDGFLVDSADEAASAVSAVKDLDRDRIREDVRRRFGADRMVDDYLRIYRKVIR